MIASKETAMEMALGANGIVVVTKMLTRAMQELILLQEQDNNIHNPHMNSMAECMLKSKDILDILMDHYNKELGKVTDETPTVKDEVKTDLRGHDVINAIELSLRMSAQDRLTQLILRGKN